MNAMFAQYNALLLRLRELARRAECEVVRLDAEAGTPIGHAHRELAQLDSAIAKRQAQATGSNVVRLATIDREILVLHRCESELQPIIAESETASSTTRSRRKTTAVYNHRGQQRFTDRRVVYSVNRRKQCELP